MASKCTEETIKTIVDCIQRGLTDKDAAAVAGIRPETLCRWQSLKDDDYQPQAAQAIARARSDGKNEMLKAILKHAAADWRAAAWVLAHRYPDEFSEKRIVETRESPDSPLEKFYQIANNAGDEEEPSDGS